MNVREVCDSVGGRKFILAIVILVIFTVLLILNRIGVEQYLMFVTGDFVAFACANAIQKIGK